MKPIALIALSLFAIGCQSSGAKSFATVAGTYEGGGKFTADAGAMDVQATLELLENGRYRLEIKPLGRLGREEGVWTQAGSNVTLSPEAIPGETVLNAMSSAKKPKTWALAPGNASISLNDGPMSIKLERK